MKSTLPSNAFCRGLEGVIRTVGIAAGWWLLVISFFTCVEMLGRKVFGFSLQGVDEIGSYTFAIVTAFGFSYALITRGHTRVDFLINRLPGAARALINVFAMLSLSATAAFFAYRAWFVLADSIALNSTAPTPLSTPLWIPQSIWFGAYVVFAVTAVVAASHSLTLLFHRDWQGINTTYGPQTLEEEIEAEAAIHVPRAATPAEAAR